MSEATSLRLTWEQWSEILSDPVKDDRYLRTALGGTVLDFLSWMENEKNAAADTIETYRRDLATLAVLFPTKPAEEFTKDDIRKARDLFPPKSRRRALAAYKSCFKWLYNEDRIPADPAAKIPYPQRHAKKVHKIFSEAEEAQIITAGPNKEHGRAVAVRDRLCILLLLRAGIRREELQQMRVEDVDLIERWIIVRRGKGNKSRVVPIAGSGELVRAFEEFMLTELPKLGRTPEDADHLLYPYGRNEHGLTWVKPERAMSDTAHWHWWRGCVRRAGVKYRSGHVARHTLGTRALRQAGPQHAQKILGHQSIKTTVDEYGHLDLEDARAIIEQMEAKRGGEVPVSDA